ncbi:site-specific integrase [Acidobacteria bacterium AH-259-A15]|nr:site-specific integrase [Acidobacteria bacterium AH-259-A15]
MTERSPLDLSPCIGEYHHYMKQGGYAATTRCRRLKHLHYLQAFVKQQGLTSLQDFRPQQSADFIDYWVRHNPGAKTSTGFNRKSRFEPGHHIGLQYTLRSFFRWARSVGYLKRDTFPVREPVRGNYFFAQTTEYLDFCQEHKGLAKNTLYQIELFLRRFDHFLHSHQIQDFNHMQIQHIDRFVQEQASHNVRRIQRVHKILRGFLRYLFSRGQLQRDWASALHSPRQYRLAHTPRALASNQVLAVLRSIDRQKPGGKRDFAVILLAASLGVRCTEIAFLRLPDLHWKRQTVRFEQAKNRHLLHMPLPRPLIEALVDYLKNERPANSPHSEVFLRLTAPRGPLHPGSLSGLIAKRIRQAGMAASAHQLRHAFASELLRAGVGYSTLQELLGHRHLTSTQIYTKINLAQLREVAENDAQDY